MVGVTCCGPQLFRIKSLADYIVFSKIACLCVHTCIYVFVTVFVCVALLKLIIINHSPLFIENVP